MMEDIVTFLPGQLPGEERFAVEMTGITWPDARYHIEREHSPLHCLEYVISGEGHIVMEGREYRPKAGDAYLLAAGKDHSYWADGERPWKKIWMNISGPLADALVAGYGLADAVVFENCPVYAQFWEFLRVCRASGKNSRELSERAVLLFHEILLKLSENLRSARQRADGRERSAAEETAFQTKEYIDAHIYEKITMPELAQAASLSASQLSRIFRKVYGQSPYDYVLARKTDTACRLLLNTGMSVKEVAYRLGFADEHYFSNVFSKRTGLPPGRYRTEGGGFGSGPCWSHR
ncbi:MAG TPA: AraC family transcriptional regulator [Candidatus Eisenbergiella merdavium]|uniref:AraC family transcriptional regulator n=1 Tax=Candidatus Eisenbergiella merdavium TaxID=2838551 RepID=A0A9D2SP50_9FIRM|nr:AraC family transcriptional regulator [Candidatus Eisenbergiella merdavium]